MARCGAVLLCGLFFLSVARPACSCPEMFQNPCKGYTSYSKPIQCGVDRLWCTESGVEIQFGGSERRLKVVRVPNLYDRELEIEDPALSSLSIEKDCAFLCVFPEARPPFSLPQTNSGNDLYNFSFSNCEVSIDSFVDSGFIKLNEHGACTAYDLYYYAPQEQFLKDAELGKRCRRPARPPPTWKLSVIQEGNGGSSFTVISVGFSRFPQLPRDCFNCEMRRDDCEPYPVRYSSCPCTNKCHKKNKHVVRNVIIGVCTATGLSVLLASILYLWLSKKKMKTLPTSSTSLSRSVSSEPFSEEDPEETSIQYPTHIFKYEELHEATNGFSPSNLLDSGGHGAVYKGKLRDGRIVAIKRLFQNSRNRAELFMNEVAILSRLCHPNLVALYGCTSRHSRDLLLVYELVSNGTIADHLHGHRAAEGALTWPVRLRVAVETATALAYLHANTPPIVHRDVKTKNILLDQDLHVKVADFGLSRLFPAAASHVSTVPQGTPGYVDPEYHRCYQLTDKSDVYSFGVVLAELISSKPAVDVARSRQEINLGTMAFHRIQNATLRELVDPELGFERDSEVRRAIELVADLAMRCLQDEREDRPTMEDVRQVLCEIQDRCHQAEKQGDVNHAAAEDIGVGKNNAPVSPDSVVGKWSSGTMTSNASG